VRVGIVIPAYNAAHWVGDAMASVVAQTYGDWRLVVVDDGSIDGTSDLVARFADRRITLIRQANAGVSAARNRGIAELFGEAPSRYPPPTKGGRTFAVSAVLFLDADDWLAADALARLIDSLGATPDAVAAVGPYTDGTHVQRPLSGDILPRLLVRNLFANGGHLLIRAEAIRAAGRFRTDIAYGEDWEYWIRIAVHGPFAVTAGRAPVLFVRQQDCGAYRRLAANPESFVPCTEAIFTNPSLLARFGPVRLAAIHRRTEAENAWIIGRELIRHGHSREGRIWLRRSVRAASSLKRIALIATSVFPIGPFVPYAVTGRASFACNEPTSPCGRKMMNTTSNVP
jgi:glycosyltransferase involved in cell wall biosynthesis